mgnify:CR=1 FL=1
METADMVKVAVSAAPYSIDKPYSYLVPESLAAAAVPGVRVMVPFGRGNKESEGLILARVQEPKLPGSKALRQVLDPEPVLDKAGIDLALWMRGRYFCTVFEAVKTILPAGLWYGLREIWSLAMEPETARSAAVGIPGAWQVLDLLEKQGGKADIRVLRDVLGDGAEKPLKAMKKAEILTCETDAKRKIADKSHRMVELAVNTEDAYALTEPKRRSAPARYEVVNFLATAGRTPAAEVSYYTGASARTLKTMEKAGLIAFSEEEELRVPSLDDVEPGPEIVLNEEQQRAFEEILGRVQAAKPSVTLLHGVTGSGKTQVYLRLVQETLALGKTAMVLVPEIVLTPQMMRKFSSYFGSRVAMLHSSLKMTERYDQWKRIRRGEVDVVLGTRSALFAPLKNLGLIIMDEEQEGSYQSENVPRYDAREVAKYLCVREKAALVFGSATPTVETAWAAEQGSYQKALLRRRYNENALPEVLIADLRQEILNGNPGLISTPLRQELEKNLAAGEQSILFLNRRGSSRMRAGPAMTVSSSCSPKRRCTPTRSSRSRISSSKMPPMIHSATKPIPPFAVYTAVLRICIIQHGAVLRQTQLAVGLHPRHLRQILQRVQVERPEERFGGAVQPRSSRHLQPPALLDQVPVQQQAHGVGAVHAPDLIHIGPCGRLVVGNNGQNLQRGLAEFGLLADLKCLTDGLRVVRCGTKLPAVIDFQKPDAPALVSVVVHQFLKQLFHRRPVNIQCHADPIHLHRFPGGEQDRLQRGFKFLSIHVSHGSP